MRCRSRDGKDSSAGLPPCDDGSMTSLRPLLTPAPPPRSAAEVARQSVMLAGAGAAILLQVADHRIGAGVAAHSRFTEDPIARLRHTLQYICVAVLPEAQFARAEVLAHVHRAHAPVRGVDSRGRAYSAFDPDAQLWVAATLYWAGEQVRRLVWGTLPAGDAERMYREYAALATSLGVPEEKWPTDRAAFEAYWDAHVAGLELTPEARAITDDLFSGQGLPLPLRAVLPLARLLTAGLLPARVRAGLGWDWGGRDSRREARTWAVAAPVYRRLPEAVQRSVVRWILRTLRG
jgi:uncharacterized protein (DUF2236 family)